MSQYERQLEQRLLRYGPHTREEEEILQRVREQQARVKRWHEEDLQLLQEEFAIIEPNAVRVDIHSYVDQSDHCIVVKGIDVHDELGHLIPYQGQDGDNWIEALSPEYLGYILHCMNDAEACGDHVFNLK